LNSAILSGVSRSFTRLNPQSPYSYKW